MSRNWDDDLDDMESAAGLFEQDPRSEMVTVWIADDETDAMIVADLLEENNIIASLVPAGEAGKYALLGPSDWIHVQVCKTDAGAAIEMLEDVSDIPGMVVAPDGDDLFEEDDQLGSPAPDEPL